MRATTLLFPALSLLLAACGPAELPEHRESAAAGARLTVHALTLAPQDWPATYEATGTVRARTATVIASKVTGYVQQVSAQTGDRVGAGQTLVTLDASDLETGYHRAEAARAEVESTFPEADSAVSAARASFDLAQVTFRRMEKLYAQKSISSQEYDEASSRLKAAQAAHEMARARRVQLDARLQAVQQEARAAAITRDYARIRSPFAGMVTARTVEPGSLATPGAPLLTIERAGEYRLEAAVDETRLAGVRVGQSVRVALDSPGCNIGARVSEVGPSVDAASRSYLVRIDLPCKDLRSGAFGRALFPLGSRRVLAIPAGALTERGQIQSVFVADNGLARTRLITTGERSGDWVEVLSGLNGGEMLLTSIPAGLSDGAAIEVQQ